MSADNDIYTGMSNNVIIGELVKNSCSEKFLTKDGFINASNNNFSVCNVMVLFDTEPENSWLNIFIVRPDILSES